MRILTGEGVPDVHAMMQLPLFPLVPSLSHSTRMSSSGCASAEVSGTAGAMVKNASIAGVKRRMGSAGGRKASRCEFDELLRRHPGGIYTVKMQDSSGQKRKQEERRENPRSLRGARGCLQGPVERRFPHDVEWLTIRNVGPSTHGGVGESSTAWCTSAQMRVVPCTLVPYAISRAQGERS